MAPIRIPARPDDLACAPPRAALVVLDMQNASPARGGDRAGSDVPASPPVIAAAAAGDA